MTLEKLMEVKGEESDLEDDVVVEQFKIFWKERREKKKAKKESEKEHYGILG
jgi:hypothetical protein